VRYGHGFHPFGTPSRDDMELLRSALAHAGRDISELELIGGIRGRFGRPDSVADLDEALEQVPAELARGATSICFKPSMFTDRVETVPEVCARVLEAVRVGSMP
jgi:hypothetical protein